MQHVPKKHLDFENPITNNPNKFDTRSRIFGHTTASEMTTEQKIIGTGKNPADALPKIGKKQQEIESVVSTIFSFDVK